MNLEEFFEVHPKVAIAFSGGVDSAYLLYAATVYKADVQAYYVKSQFQPAFELIDAQRIAKQLGIELRQIDVDVLADDMVCSNPSNRCYYCKQRIFQAILDAAHTDGYTTILDGTNASDDADDRPGMKALLEKAVLSPLRICGITKAEVREASKKAGLFTWDKPAYACLATRIKTQECITEDKLFRIERAETDIAELGFVDFRVRLSNGHAKLQLRKDQILLYQEKKIDVQTILARYFDSYELDKENMR